MAPPGSAYAPGAPMVATRQTNGLSVASLVLGIVWVLGIGSILAVIFGFVARKQIKESGGRQTGEGLALAGIILGFVGVLGLILWIVLIAVVANTVAHCEQVGPDGNNTVCTTTPVGGGSHPANAGRSAGSSSNSGFATSAAFGHGGSSAAWLTQGTLSR
jgi:hypothetical protein